MADLLDFVSLSHYTDKFKEYFANLVSNKVDKVSGKALSENDLTNALKANYDAAYTHAESAHAPNDAEKNTIVKIKQNGIELIPDSTRVIDLGTVLTGGEQTSTSTIDGGSNVYTFSDGSTITVKNGSKGSNGTTPIIKAEAGEDVGVVGTPTVTASTSGNTTTFTFNNLKGAKGDKGESGTNATTTAVATQSTNGLMSKDDKTKIDGIAENANKYTHPTTSGNKHIPSGGSSGQILRWSADGTATWGADNNTTYSNFVKSGTGAKAGLVPAPSTTAGTTKYLREDGTWATPSVTNVSTCNGGISYSDAKPSTLRAGMFWIGNAK